MATTIDRLEVEIQASAANAAKEVELLYQKLSDVAKVLNGMGKGFTITNKEISKTTVTVKNLSSSTKSLGSSEKHVSSLHNAFHKLGSICGSVGSGMASAAGKITTSFSLIGSASKHLARAKTGLASLLRVAIGFYGIRTLFNWGKQAIELSSDLTEVQNVVENSFGTKGTQKVEDFAKTCNESFGLSELAAKQMSSRFQAMGNAMGITTGQVAKATQNVADKIDKSYSQTGDEMGDMAINLTKLTADMASFYNQDYETVAEAMKSVYTGMSRPLDKYGLSLRQATLQEYANAQGMNVKVSEMTQAEKTLLRYQYVMSHTATVQGDFNRTQDTYANQVKVLRQNLQMLAATIGETLINALKPAIKWLNTIIGSVISFAETVGNALGKIFGWQILHTPASNAADEYDTMAEAVEDIADAGDDASGGLDKATKAAEKLKRTILGFDELNVLNGNDDTPSSTSGGSSGKTSTPTVADSVPAASGADFQIVKGQSLFEDYKSKIDSLEELGEYIGSKLKATLKKIDWENEVYPGAEEFGTGLASFLNGLFDDPDVFGEVGKAAGASLNTAMHVIDGFGSTFDWSAYGKALGTGFRNFIKTFDWKLSAKSYTTFTNGYVVAFRNAIAEIPWESFGSDISGSITSALGGILWEEEVFPAADEFGKDLAKFLKGLITPETFKIIGSTVARRIKTALIFLNSFGKQMQEDGTFGKFGESIAAALNAFFLDNDLFLKLTHTFNTWALGLVETVSKALRRTQWNKIGKKIREAIEDVKFGEILEGVETVIADAINGVIELAAGLLNIDSLDGPFADAINNIKLNVENITKNIDFAAFAEAVGKVVDALAPAVGGFGEGFISAISALAGIGGVALEFIGFGLQAIANALNMMDPDLLQEIGRALGVIAGALFGLKLANGVVSIISGVATKLGLLSGAAAGAEAAVVGSTAGGAAATGGVVGALSNLVTKTKTAAGAFLTNGGFVTAVSAGVTWMAKLQDKVNGGNGKLNEMSGMLDAVNKVLAENGEISPETVRKINDLGEAYEDGKIDVEQFKDGVLKAYEDAGISIDEFDKALSGFYETGLAPTPAQQEMMDHVFDGLDSSSGRAKGALSELVKKVPDVVKNIGDIGGSAEDSGKKSDSFKDGIWKFAGGVAAQAILMAVMGGAFKGIGDKAEDNGEKVKGFADSFDTLNDELGNKRKQYEATGQKLTDGITQGFSSGLAGFDAAVLELADSGDNTFKKKEGVNSPSTVWAGFGRNLVQGLSNGIGSEEKTITNKVSSLVSSLSGAFKGLADTMYDIGQTIGKSLANGMKNTYMPSLKYYISDWRYHDLGDGGTSATPVYSPWWYASGGFPNKGELFFANENGPEMVGRMGSRNVVANNKQITEGIRAAVVDGFMEAFMSTGGGQSTNTPFVINAVLKTENDEVLARAVERGTARRNARFNPA